jgi:hypothetical protein
MFVSYFVGLPLPLTAVEAALTRSLEAWVPALARAADAPGERLLAEVGFRLGGDGEGAADRKAGRDRAAASTSVVRRGPGCRSPGGLRDRSPCSPASTASSRSCRSGPAPNPGSAPNTCLRSAPIGRGGPAVPLPGGRGRAQGTCRLRERRPDTARGQRPIRADGIPLLLMTQPLHRRLVAGG